MMKTVVIDGLIDVSSQANMKRALTSIVKSLQRIIDLDEKFSKSAFEENSIVVTGPAFYFEARFTGPVAVDLLDHRKLKKTKERKR
jgi:hypothetical protein